MILGTIQGYCHAFQNDVFTVIDTAKLNRKLSEAEKSKVMKIGFKFFTGLLINAGMHIAFPQLHLAKLLAGGLVVALSIDAYQLYSHVSDQKTESTTVLGEARKKISSLINFQGTNGTFFKPTYARYDKEFTAVANWAFRR